MDYKKYPNRTLRHILSFPFIWGMLIPLALFDICLEIYHQICFRLYKLPRVKRSNYIKIDRHKLKYLAWYEKINCAYCGYANGLVNYATVIAARTEQYWCGIKHKKDHNFIPPVHHKDFLEYGDERRYNGISNKNKNNNCQSK
jgi:hypothetical protein